MFFEVKRTYHIKSGANSKSKSIICNFTTKYCQMYIFGIQIFDLMCDPGPQNQS